MTKLYSVKLSFDYVIAVEDGEDPAFVAVDNANDAFHDITRDIFDVEVKPYESGDVAGWDNECIPYGGDGTKRTGDYLKEVE